ncbi:MAG: hypothetical protein KDB73_08680 [Planctomycetes bacterium]|nr:hypothetical protein [Planctomycetota bacterium]
MEIVRRVRRSGRDVLEIDPGLLEGRLIRMTAGACLRIDKLDLDWSASGGSLQILPGGERTEVSPASGYFLSPVTLAHDPDELGAAVASLPSSKDAVGADRRITIRSSEGHTEVVYEVDEKVDWLPSTCLEYRDNSLLAISFYAWRRTEDLGWYPLAAFRVARKRGPSRSDAPERAEIRASYFRSPGRAGSGQQLVLSIPPKTVIVDAQVEPRRVYHAESVESWPEALRQHAKLLGAALIDEAGDPQAPAPAR